MGVSTPTKPRAALRPSNYADIVAKVAAARKNRAKNLKVLEEYSTYIRILEGAGDLDDDDRIDLDCFRRIVRLAKELVGIDDEIIERGRKGLALHSDAISLEREIESIR